MVVPSLIWAVRANPKSTIIAYMMTVELPHSTLSARFQSLVDLPVVGIQAEMFARMAAPKELRQRCAKAMVASACWLDLATAIMCISRHRESRGPAMRTAFRKLCAPTDDILAGCVRVTLSRACA
jgi:hypothetical protein